MLAWLPRRAISGEVFASHGNDQRVPTIAETALCRTPLERLSGSVQKRPCDPVADVQGFGSLGHREIIEITQGESRTRSDRSDATTVAGSPTARRANARKVSVVRSSASARSPVRANTNPRTTDSYRSRANQRVSRGRVSECLHTKPFESRASDLPIDRNCLTRRFRCHQRFRDPSTPLCPLHVLGDVPKVRSMSLSDSVPKGCPFGSWPHALASIERSPIASWKPSSSTDIAMKTTASEG
ncbi:MAG: hypothetical protein ACI9OJ_005254 [Myxococcota bacterium]|jgi:hypothetical protein